MTTSKAVSASPPVTGAPAAKLSAVRLSVYYGDFQALREVTIAVRPRAITGLIGPSGCGKSTLLRCFNRMNDTVRSFRAEGTIRLDGHEILGGGVNLASLRKRVGMVFQRPNPFPLSIFDNVAYGPRIHGMDRGNSLKERVERSLAATGLWGTVKDRLQNNALSLSAEEQQRLCISRLLAVEPEVLLMDEPCSALDPISTAKIEELMRELKNRYTVVIVTHNMQQASRVSDDCGFMWLGELVEFAPTREMFTRPSNPRTEGYIQGRFG